MVMRHQHVGADLPKLGNPEICPCPSLYFMKGIVLMSSPHTFATCWASQSTILASPNCPRTPSAMGTFGLFSRQCFPAEQSSQEGLNIIDKFQYVVFLCLISHLAQMLRTSGLDTSPSDASAPQPASHPIKAPPCPYCFPKYPMSQRMGQRQISVNSPLGRERL